MVWFLLCNGLNIILDNDERSGGSQCIGVGQAHVENIEGYRRVSHTDHKQTYSVVISHCSGVNVTSQAVLNTINMRRIIESNITSSLATVYNTNALITSVRLPSA